MITAFISDIHGNLVALEATLKKIRHLHVDCIVSLGDVVGYGPWPAESLDLVMGTCDFAVIGNHDAGVSGRLDTSGYYDAVRYMLEWSKEKLQSKQIDYLKSLPFLLQNDKENWVASHGSPLNPEKFNYILNSNQASALHNTEGLLKQIAFLGHSHTMQLFLLNSQGAAVELATEEGVFDISTSAHTVCIAGSVGQPRDNDPRSGFVLYNSEEQHITFHRVKYSIKNVIKEMKQQKLPRSFAERLRKGI